MPAKAKFYTQPPSKWPNNWKDNVRYETGRFYSSDALVPQEVRVLTVSEGSKRKKLWLEDHFRAEHNFYDYPRFSVAAIRTSKPKKYPPKFLVFFQNDFNTPYNQWILNNHSDLWRGSILIMKLGASCSYSKGWDGPKRIQRKDVCRWNWSDNDIADVIVERLLSIASQTGSTTKAPNVPLEFSVWLK